MMLVTEQDGCRPTFSSFSRSSDYVCVSEGFSLAPVWVLEAQLMLMMLGS